MYSIVRSLIVLAGLPVLASLAHAAADAPAPAPAPTPSSIHEALAMGKFSLNARLRWENADQVNLRPSDAFTLRTRYGFTSAPLEGIQGMIEGENIVSIGDRDNYNAAGSNPGGAGRTVIADAPTNELNQAWIAHTAGGTTVKIGRQRIVLDNTRFVGDVGWRQNAQTFDALTFTGKPAENLTAFYGYVNHVNRPFGNKPPQRDFSSDSHLVNLSYRGWKAGTLTAYAYLLDFDNSLPNSSATYGVSFAGGRELGEKSKLTYRLEYATQRDNGDNPLNYSADYHLVEVGVTVSPFNFGIGHEVLGSDAGAKGFATPLATLHAFNGWADVFLATPAAGLRNLYLSAGATIAGKFPVRVVWHDFSSDVGGTNFGSELDAQISHKVDQNWTVLAKVAKFDGSGPYFDTTKYWLQAEFNF